MLWLQQKEVKEVIKFERLGRAKRPEFASRDGMIHPLSRGNLVWQHHNVDRAFAYLFHPQYIRVVLVLKCRTILTLSVYSISLYFVNP